MGGDEPDAPSLSWILLVKHGLLEILRGLLFKQKDHHGDIIGIPNEIVKKIPALDTRSPCDEVHFSVPSVPSMKTNQTTVKSRRLFLSPTQPSPDLLPKMIMGDSCIVTLIKTNSV